MRFIVKLITQAWDSAWKDVGGVKKKVSRCSLKQPGKSYYTTNKI